MKKRIIINEDERKQILDLHKLNSDKFISESIEIKAGMKGVSVLQDNAQGFSGNITSVTPYNKCGIIEVVFGNRYAYYKTSEQDFQRNEISFKRYGEGVKSNDPCTNWAEMGNWGRLKIEGASAGTQNPQSGVQGRKKNCSETGKPSCNQKVLDVQVRLNDKCDPAKLGTKLVEDGLYGLKTQTAIKSCTGLDSSTPQPAPQGGEVGQLPTKPAEQIPTASSGTQPAAGTQPASGEESADKL